MSKTLKDLAESLKNHPANMSVADYAKTQIKSPLEELGKSLSELNGFNRSIGVMQPLIPPSINIPRVPTDRERNDYQSAAVLMRELADTIAQWRTAVPEDTQPAILAILYGGIQIHVNSLEEVSFHGIRIEGTLNGLPCVMLAHQSTVQLLCYVQRITEEEPKRKIGFIIGNQAIEV